MQIIDCKLLNDIPGNMHVMFNEDKEGRWIKEAEKMKSLDLNKVYRLRGVMWVPVKEVL